MDYKIGIDDQKATYGNREFKNEVPLIEQPKQTRQISGFNQRDDHIILKVRPKGYYENKRARKKIASISRRKNRR